MLHVDNNLLEVGGLPVSQLATLADKESRQPQAVYTAHKWFARRLGTSMRALLVGLASRDIDQFWNLFNGDTCFDGQVLDPFVGGGTTVTEAARIGLKTIGIDIDPVAVAITGFQMQLPRLGSILPLIERLQRDVGGTIQKFHDVEGPDGEMWTAVHHFWVQTVNCAECGHHYELHPHFVIAETSKNKSKTVLCKTCGVLALVKLNAKRLSCGCGTYTRLNEGTVQHGVAQCPACDHKETVIDIVRNSGKPPNFKLFAHEIISDPEHSKIPMTERVIVPATDITIARFHSAERLAEEYSDKLPKAKIGVHHKDSRLVAYNRTQISSLFNGRQRLHLGQLLGAIDQLKGSDRIVAAIAFSDHLRTNNILCGYSVGWRRLRPLFAIRGWHHVVRPVELNPWLDRIGRGTYVNALKRINRASETAMQPRGTAPTNRTEFAVAEIRQGSSVRLSHIGTETVDLVLTDPPYFDKLAYGDLADFFRPWMKQLGLTKNNQDLADELGSLAKSDVTKFTDRLAACLGEATRTLKEYGRFVFTFQSDEEGWSALGEALYRSGLEPLTCFPLLGDAGSGDHKRINSKRWDAVLCLEKPAGWKRQRKKLLRCDATDSEWARKLTRQSRNELKSSAVVFGLADCHNLESAAFVLASLRKRTRRRSAPKLLEVLKANASVKQEGPKPVHP